MQHLTDRGKHENTIIGGNSSVMTCREL